MLIDHVCFDDTPAYWIMRFNKLTFNIDIKDTYIHGTHTRISYAVQGKKCCGS
jgi:hypothetical protein